MTEAAATEAPTKPKRKPQPKAKPKPKPKQPARPKPQPVKPQPAPPQQARPPALLVAIESSLDDLRVAILGQDWAAVRAAFTRLTGCELPPPDKEPPYREALRSILGIATRAVGGVSGVNLTASNLADEIFGEPDATPGQVAASPDEMQFVTDLRGGHDEEERRLSRLESERAKRRDSNPPRPAFQTVQVTCTRCRTQCSVHPVLVPRRLDPEDADPDFICDDCQVNRGVH